MKQRFFFELAYNGKEFFGWQIQPKSISVQEVIEKALSQLHSNIPVKVIGCGRTDTGVHAHHFVLHTELPGVWDKDELIFKLNRMLPDSISINKIYPVEPDKHARFSATARTYRYFVHQKKDPFKTDFSWYLPQELDIKAMNKAAAHLIGTKDFTSLSKLHTDVKTNICTVKVAEWTETGQDTLCFEIAADRFLRNMVRATVGTLIEVGLGKIDPSTVIEILEAKDRSQAANSAPAQGLFLWKIEY